MKSGFFGVGLETLPGTREGGLWIRRFRRFGLLETPKLAGVDRHVTVFGKRNNFQKCESTK